LDVLLETKELKKFFYTRNGTLHAVDGVSLSIEQGKTLGVVGESGCGKSTLGRVLLHLLDSTSGKIFFEGKDITVVSKSELKELRKNMQMIFQDPFSSVNPRMTVGDIIGEPLIIHNICSNKEDLESRIEELMNVVGLAKRVRNSYPHELDGGRRQRIGIARALSLEPKFIVCDEPVSALDVSIQAQVLNLMQDLQQMMGITYLFITHNLSVVKHISDEICVMYLGTLVEKSDAKELFKKQYHPYTKALLSAIPQAKLNKKRERIMLKGELTSPINLGPGCRFAPRCSYAAEECSQATPALIEIDRGRFVACHYAGKI
jgi:peptide/nickel transport system ATP-binding protein